MGRAWESQAGNLFASTIVRIRPSDPPAPTLAFVAALAAHHTVQQIAPDVVVQVKWPNDLLSGEGAKLCGMLLERAGDAVIVGIGMNLVSHPQGLDRPITDLVTLGALPPHPQAVVEILADAFATWLGRWRMGGMQAVLRSWQAISHPVGTALNVNLPDGTVDQGLYAGLSDEGALQLRLEDGAIRAIHAGDVFLI
jgi:BirA family biotin operon repressor/biotin-[acetyl-CoA-carboxylase] ligase